MESYYKLYRDDHALPQGIREHELSPNCWCKPKLNYEDPLTGTRHWVHRDWDELEAEA